MFHGLPRKVEESKGIMKGGTAVETNHELI